MIQIKSVSKSYGTHRAVSSLSLTISPGEVFAFLGANGAGKTTTIKMLVGLLTPDAGSISIGPHDVVEAPRDASHLVGYVPDQPYVYDKLTGHEFLEFIAQIYGLEPRDAAESIARQIETFRLESFINRLTETYSHGMKQRLVFASALVHCPQIVVLDEPMVGLDPHSMRIVKDLLRREADSGTTIFMSTHTLPLAEEIADRIGVVTSGELQFEGSVDELRARDRQGTATLEQLFLDLTAIDSGESAAE